MGKENRDARKRGYERRYGTFRSQEIWSGWEDPDEEEGNVQIPDEKPEYQCRYGTFSAWDRCVFSAGGNAIFTIMLSAGGIPFIEYSRSCGCSCDCFWTDLIIPTRWDAFELSYLSEIGIKTESFEWIRIHGPYEKDGTDPEIKINGLSSSNYPGVPYLKTLLESLGAKLNTLPSSPDEEKTVWELSSGERHVGCFLCFGLSASRDEEFLLYYGDAV